MKKRPTLQDVAKVANVSRATAARVVNGNNDIVRPKTRERVLEVVRQLGYERHAIAGSLRSERTYMIALSIPDITNPFWPEVARGVQDTFGTAGYTVVLLNNDWNAMLEQEHLRRMRQKQFDGLIINPTGTLNADLLELPTPIVLLASGEAYPDFDTVSSDSAQAGTLAIEHLIGLGHRRVAFAGGPRESIDTRDRHRGLSQALDEARLELPDERVWFGPHYSPEAGAEYARSFLAKPPRARPSAVVMGNDAMALGFMRSVLQRGVQVPDDVSVTGFDGIPEGGLYWPGLTTVLQPAHRMGASGCRALLEIMQNPSLHRTADVQYGVELIVRESTAEAKVGK